MPPSAQARSIAPVAMGTTTATPQPSPTRKPPSRSKSGSSAGPSRRSKSPSKRRSHSMSRKGTRRGNAVQASSSSKGQPAKSCLKRPDLPAKPKRNIVFAQRVRVQCIPHVDDMDDDVIDAIWYVKAEFDVMKKEMTETIRYMMAMNTIEDDPEGKYFTRGLECRTKQGAKARQQRKMVGWLGVLDEQDRLFDLKDEPSANDSWESIRMAYQTSADQTRHAAMLQGKKDRETIEEYIREDTEARCAAAATIDAATVAAPVASPSLSRRAPPGRSKSSASALPSVKSPPPPSPGRRTPGRSKSSKTASSSKKSSSSSTKPPTPRSPTKTMMRKIIAKSPLRPSNSEKS